MRVFDCRGEDAFLLWEAKGEVEKVLWNHFQPFNFFVSDKLHVFVHHTHNNVHNQSNPTQASTDSGHVQLFDVRRADHPVWTLGAHPDGSGANGMALSSQCPGCLITVSSDK